MIAVIIRPWPRFYLQSVPKVTLSMWVYKQYCVFPRRKREQFLQALGTIRARPQRTRINPAQDGSFHQFAIINANNGHCWRIVGPWLASKVLCAYDYNDHLLRHNCISLSHDAPPGNLYTGTGVVKDFHHRTQQNQTNYYNLTRNYRFGKTNNVPTGDYRSQLKMWRISKFVYCQKQPLKPPI